MARINTNIPSLIAQSSLSRANDDLALRLQRLSTGLRINRGADDPAGLIVSERLRSELQGLERAIGNSERASSVIATTEAYLTEVSDLLTSIKGLVIEAANTGGVSDEEIAANQLQVDSAIESITRISNTASFAGLQLLNGSLAYLTSGVATSALTGVDIFGAQFGTNSSIPVQVEVISSAQTGQLFLSGTAVGALTSSVSIEIAGMQGVQVLTFVSGTSMQAVVDAVNTVSESTGVSASLVSATDQSSGLTFNSLTYGSDAFVSVRKTGAGGDFFRVFGDANIETQRDTGRDVTAIINGTLATGDGLDVSLNTPSLRLELNLTPGYAQTTGSVKSFDITGGGVTFQLGPEISSTQQVGVGFKSIAASRIGGTLVGGVRYFLDSLKSGGANSLVGGRAREAALVLDASITEVSVLRGRIGAFERNTIQTNIRSLQVGFENIASSESKIRDTDFAAETAALTRAQILTQAGTSVLATANLTSQNVLALLQ
ncbi:MAG: flagellin [Planctomycetes bacterium]|nr:flagellin [Planctomycetota bacterium]